MLFNLAPPLRPHFSISIEWRSNNGAIEPWWGYSRIQGTWGRCQRRNGSQRYRSLQLHETERVLHVGEEGSSSRAGALVGAMTIMTHLSGRHIHVARLLLFARLLQYSQVGTGSGRRLCSTRFHGIKVDDLKNEVWGGGGRGTSGVLLGLAQQNWSLTSAIPRRSTSCQKAKSLRLIFNAN